MNLRVDLILESEQRSASMISLKSVLRVLAVVIPVVIAGFLALRVADMMRLQSEVKGLESAWKQLEPKTKTAATLKEQRSRNGRILEEMEGWNRSRISWHEQLEALMEEVPADMQLRTLTVDQTLQLRDEEVPARVFKITLTGRAVGENAEASIQRLRYGMQSASLFADALGAVDVTRYGADTAEGAAKTDRIFQIDGHYNARRFE